MRWMLVLLAVMAVSCVDGRYGRRPGDGSNRQGDGGAADPTPIEPPPAPPGGVSLAVGDADWAFDGSYLFVEAVVANAADGAPAPLVWRALTLETDAGAILDADSSSAETCPAGLSVAPGATLGCEVGFELPIGHRPVRLHYRADAERSAQAPVPVCSPSAPQGLCEPGASCEAGRCVGPCSATEPDGFCFGAGQCIEGACQSLCSPESPHGWCAEGACFEGRCDASCYELDSGRGLSGVHHGPERLRPLHRGGSAYLRRHDGVRAVRLDPLHVRVRILARVRRLRGRDPGGHGLHRPRVPDLPRLSAPFNRHDARERELACDRRRRARRGARPPCAPRIRP